MTLQLELGKKYLNRRGEVVEIVYRLPRSYTHCYEDSTGLSYTPIGEYYEGDFNLLDLVSEYVEPSTKPAETSNKTPHIHRDLIIAWASGSEIEYLDQEDGEFYFAGIPSWDVDIVYRIKPEKITQTVPAWVSNETAQVHVLNPNLSLTFEDGKLIKAEVL